MGRLNTLTSVIVFLLHLTLKDADECDTGNHVCHVQALCNNTNGSYTCQCGQGWSGDGNTCQGKRKVNFINIL